MLPVRVRLQVTACNFLCHPYAKNLLMLTVEVRTRTPGATPHLSANHVSLLDCDPICSSQSF